MKLISLGFISYVAKNPGLVTLPSEWNSAVTLPPSTSTETNRLILLAGSECFDEWNLKIHATDTK